MKKRPEPPPGFIPFKWKTRQHAANPDAPEWTSSVNVCPNCGAPAKDGDKWGYAYFGGGWTDPGAQAAYDEGTAQGIVVMGAGSRAITCDDTPILCHWSRYGLGKCMICGVELWHDFVGFNSGPNDQWQYYYKPLDGQLALF